MFTRSLSSILFLIIAISSAAFAADDPMKSLFLFQQKMADNGSAPAMMKMGKMYERGDGVKKDYDKAIKMYQKAHDAGHAKANAALKRLKDIKNKSANINNRKAKKKEQERRQALAKEKQRKQQKVAARKKAQAAKKAANEKAIREAKKKEKSAKLASEAKAKKLREAKAKAKKEAKARAALKLKAKGAKDAKAKSAREEKARAIRIAAEKKRQETKNPKEGFKSDPCKGKAARLLSICR